MSEQDEFKMDMGRLMRMKGLIELAISVRTKLTREDTIGTIRNLKQCVDLAVEHWSPRR